MLEQHKEKEADITIAVLDVPKEEASRFGIMTCDEEGRIVKFTEKPKNPDSTLASMGIYIFNWKTLKEALIAKADQPALDFGKHIIPYCHENGSPLYAYEFNGYWKDVGTLNSYWEANMELIDIVPEFNLYEEYWKIYTKSDALPPQYISTDSVVERSIIGEGTEIYGKVYNSVIGRGIVIGKDTVVRDSIIMKGTVIGDNTTVNKAIIAENCYIGECCEVAAFEEVPNSWKPDIYNNGMVTIGENSIVPDRVKIGKNTAISGGTTIDDYPRGILPSGENIIKAGDRV